MAKKRKNKFELPKDKTIIIENPIDSIINLLIVGTGIIALILITALFLGACSDDPWFYWTDLEASRRKIKHNIQPTPTPEPTSTPTPTGTPVPSPTGTPVPSPTPNPIIYDCDGEYASEGQIYVCIGEGRDYITENTCIASDDADGFFTENPEVNAFVCNVNNNGSTTLCIPYADLISRLEDENPGDYSGQCIN